MYAVKTIGPQKGHPRGLYVLFFTEMWERFGYYLMVGIMFLFLQDTVILFLLYGLYAVAAEGISKAWISNITDKSDTATAIGTYTGFQSIRTMLAGFITGFIWYRFGGSNAFWLTAIISSLVLLYFLLLIPNKISKINNNY